MNLDQAFSLRIYKTQVTVTPKNEGKVCFLDKMRLRLCSNKNKDTLIAELKKYYDVRTAAVAQRRTDLKKIEHLLPIQFEVDTESSTVSKKDTNENKMVEVTITGVDIPPVAEPIPVEVDTEFSTVSETGIESDKNLNDEIDWVNVNLNNEGPDPLSDRLRDARENRLLKVKTNQRPDSLSDRLEKAKQNAE